MNTEQRARFEALFPVPDGVEYTANENRYVITDAYQNSGAKYFLKAAGDCIQQSSKWEAFQAAETPLLARIAELEGQLLISEKKYTDECQAFDMQAKVLENVKTKRAELERQLANREPFVVKLPISGYASEAPIGCKIMYADDVKKAITAAGGRCE